MTAKKKTQEIAEQPLVRSEIHPYNWSVLLYTDKAAHKQYVDERRDYKLAESFYAGISGCASHIEEYGITAIFLNNPSAGVLLHECIHAVTTCFSERGVPISQDATEVLAYTTQALFEELAYAIQEASSTAQSPTVKKNVRKVSGKTKR